MFQALLSLSAFRLLRTVLHITVKVTMIQLVHYFKMYIRGKLYYISKTMLHYYYCYYYCC